jgi:glycosyltransferase involved in cell wall biosynthesis
MRYTIVTPTICRQSLSRLCESVDRQTQADWEHLVVVDMPQDRLTKDHRQVLESVPSNPNRSYFYCDRNHKNYGHTCRHQVWEHAKGDYILYVDDDDYFADKDALKALDTVTEPWAIFPVLRHGKLFFKIPPGVWKTGTGMFMHKREIGRWPDSDVYDTDGSFVEQLKQNHKYQVVDSGPIVALPKSNFGIASAGSWFGDVLIQLVSLWNRFRYYAKGRAISRTAKR